MNKVVRTLQKLIKDNWVYMMNYSVEHIWAGCSRNLVNLIFYQASFHSHNFSHSHHHCTITAAACCYDLCHEHEHLVVSM